MASPSTHHSSEQDEMKTEVQEGASSSAAGAKRKRAEKSDRSKVSKRTTKKQKFQSLLEKSDQFSVFKLLFP